MRLRSQAAQPPAGTFEVTSTTTSPPAEPPDARDAGQVVSATWAKEQFQPMQYHGFEVGPFQATTVVREGESIASATLRLHRELAGCARQAFEEKLREYVGRLDEIQAALERGRRR